MTENCEDRTNVNVKENENIDSDKSYESCVNSVTDGINNVLVKDDDSEKSFLSCSNNFQDKTEACDKNENLAPINCNKVEDDDDDDDIRPGSCRENPSSDDETSSWDENKDNWIYDAEYLQQTESTVSLPKTELTEQDLELCKEDLEYIIENHVSKDSIKQEISSKEINNPTFIPTNGKFYMHDLRLEDPKDDQLKKTNKSSKNLQSKSNESWAHDLYDANKQKPISKDELINKYGVDIRRKNDNQEFKENQLKKNQRNNFKRQNYRHKTYYDYEYYDGYDTYHSYYYDNSGYHDYNYYEPQYNSWNRPNRESNRNHIQMKNEYRNYKSNYSPEVKSKSPKPPSKYSQIAEYTNIKITVNLDNFGTREIKSISNNSNRKNYNSRIYENSNYRCVDEYTAEENQLEFSESGNYSAQKSQRESEQSSSTKKTLQEAQKRNSSQKPYLEPQNGANNQKGYGEIQRGGNNSQTQRRNNYIPAHRNYLETQRGENKSSQKNYSKSQHRFTDSNYLSEFDKTQGKSQLTNRHKQNVPDWANTKFEWDANCDFKDVIEEMPPLTEKEINQLQKRPMNPPPPRFSREKSASQFDGKTQNRVQSFVPKRYSELRNQSEPLQLSQPQPPPTQTLVEPTNQPPIINYQQIIPNLEYYNNIQPLLLNMNQGPHSASANSPQQSSNTFSSIRPQMVPLSSLIQSGGGSGGVGGGYDNSQQFYIHPVYLPTASRLNQFSQPFQPSFVSQTSPATVFPSQPSTSSMNTPNAPQSSRPVLGRS